MKVVLFCGGLGMRMREYSEVIPKPMVEIGYRPIIWHLMKYYSHFGHRDFILCLGHGGDYIKRYFLSYNEALSNDFTLTQGGKAIQLANTDIDDWSITFVDTGIKANIGERLWKVRHLLGDDEMFLANYSDGLSDLPLDAYLDFFRRSGKVGSFVSMQPTYSFHVVDVGEQGRVNAIVDLARSGLWVNGGFFAFRRSIFDFMRPGEELVHEPFGRLIEAGQLLSYCYDGFWTPMDTFKDKQRLEELDASGTPPWKVWSRADS